MRVVGGKSGGVPLTVPKHGTRPTSDKVRGALFSMINELIERKQNDIKTLMELDKRLRFLDPLDPVRYDFALFGLGVEKEF